MLNQGSVLTQQLEFCLILIAFTLPAIMHYMLLKKKLGWFMKAVDLVVFLISVALVVVCFGENLISIIFRSFCVCCMCIQERL